MNSQLDSIALEIMIEQSRQLIVVADSSKIGQVNFVPLAPLEKVDVIVLDRAASPAFCKALTELGVEIVSVDMD